jgi:hypothetical protein
MEKRKFFTLPRVELRPLGRPARSQSLYRLSYPGSQLILTSRSCAFIEKPPILQILKNFPAFYGTRRFITVFTRALHWFPS